ncbi:MAG: HEPN domain-containing protein [Candidatus Bathyarchaeia archaeon]
MAQRARDLMEDAEDFLGAALDLYKTGRWSKVCFNAQQAAELALKASLNFYGGEERTFPGGFIGGANPGKREV